MWTLFRLLLPECTDSSDVYIYDPLPWKRVFYTSSFTANFFAILNTISST
jgi:hypothetical protein